ncbi:hypothetical protein Tco_1139158 [Tanacetum coccineum]
MVCVIKHILILTPTTTEATTSVIVVPESETLTTLHQRIADLENVVKELKDVDNSSKKRKPDDADKDEGPSAGSDRGSTQAEETVFVSGDTKGLHNLREDTGNTDEPLVVNIDPNDWFKKPERPPTLDPKWNKGKSSENKPT